MASRRKGLSWALSRPAVMMALSFVRVHLRFGKSSRDGVDCCAGARSQCSMPKGATS